MEFPKRIYLPGDPHGFQPGEPYSLEKKSKPGGIAQPYVMEDIVKFLESQLTASKKECERLRGYARHYYDCELDEGTMVGDCTCGLDKLLTPTED